MADFIVEFVSPSSAPAKSATELGGNSEEDDVTSGDEATKAEQQSWKQFLGTAWKVFVDGSSTTKRSGIGIVLQSPEGLVIEQALTLGFKPSNNEAEYEALITGLDSAKALGAKQLAVFSDSQLVTSQLSGDYRARDERMAAYVSRAKQLLSQFQKVEVRQIGRESNSHADALASLGSAVEAGWKRTIEVGTLDSPSIELTPDRLILYADLDPVGWT